MAYLENHLLYYKKSCPFCQKVLRFMEANHLTMDTRETTQPGNQNDLVRIGGKKQVRVSLWEWQGKKKKMCGYAVC